MNLRHCFCFHNWSKDCQKCAKCGKHRTVPHKWDGCTCASCGAKRDEAHKWDGCTCASCGAKRDEAHKWDGCTCASCGAKRDGAHHWTGRSADYHLSAYLCCSKCGKKCTEPSAYSRLFENYSAQWKDVEDFERIGGLSAVEPMRKYVINQVAANLDMRIYVAETLVRMGDLQVADALISIASHNGSWHPRGGNIGSKIKAIKLLGACGDRRCVNGLIEYLNDVNLYSPESLARLLLSCRGADELHNRTIIERCLWYTESVIEVLGLLRAETAIRPISALLKQKGDWKATVITAYMINCTPLGIYFDEGGLNRSILEKGIDPERLQKLMTTARQALAAIEGNHA